MNQIKNLHLLTDVGEEEKLKMEHAGLLHARYSNITFKIVDYDDKKVTIQIAQGKSAAENHQNKKRLIEIVHETFDRFFPKRKILVHPIEFVESPATSIDETWINKQMLEHGITLKQIATDTGINYTQLSALITGRNPLSQPMKALFWYYFAAMK